MTVVAVGQIRVQRGDVEVNVERCLRAIEQAAVANAELLVLPECALTGYVYDSTESARAAALASDDDRIATLSTGAARIGVTTVVGFLETTESGYRNSAAVLSADGRTVVVHKTHLPNLGADRFAEPGARIGPVVDAPFGKIGVAICYDFRFPEVCRSLTLAGAEIIAVPVNWSTAVTVLAEHFVPVRAVENRVFVAVANRADREGGLEFFGSSQIVAPCGQTLARCETGEQDIELAVADVDLAQARSKSTVFDPQGFSIDVVADRRPELYGSLTREKEQ